MDRNLFVLNETLVHIEYFQSRKMYPKTKAVTMGRPDHMSHFIHMSHIFAEGWV